MNYRNLLVMLAVCAAGVDAYAQTPPRYRYERVPTEAPSCTSVNGSASDLNNAGAVVGRRCIGQRYFAFIEHDGRIKRLPQDESGSAQQLYLNDRFDVTLNLFAETGSRSLLVHGDGSTVEINPLPGDSDLVMFALNNRREVVGLSYGPSSPSGRTPVIWRDGRPTRLSSLPNSLGDTVVGINDRGVAIGQSLSEFAEGRLRQRAALWESDTVMPLPLPRRSLGTHGVDINNRGQAVINRRLQSALAINDAGQILVVEDFPNGADNPEYLVLTPVKSADAQ